ncbi:hypothetical protein GCM10022419_132890 [Nonomuraea rosea]|uniref:SH3 domain-containing protein n=1 Tax=Nonomuraea rosea TaxID=638574 RepID=A0ABP7A4I2_9ACTN
MHRILVLASASVLLAVAPAPSPAHAHTQPQHFAKTSTNCATKIEITGDKVAIRNEATSKAPIVAFVRAGDVLESCWKVIGRGKRYRKCGATHYDWYLVNAGTPKSGYVPVTCARKL